MTRRYKLLCAEHRFTYASRFPEDTEKHRDYMQLAWFYLLDWAGAPVWNDV